ncbi:MAG: hypothetical protein M0Z32_09860, partial [Actinomycetota bacterium]|nr:hypothetical protein [Actinomycetota bacterium]MDA8168027.1 hypothetical protein [Actinomycetota bacterium]
LVLVVEHHPHRTFLQLFGIPLSCVHDSILSKDGASRKVGAIHTLIKRLAIISFPQVVQDGLLPAFQFREMMASIVM